MSIVFFVIGLNIILSIGLGWVAGRMVQWRQSLQRVNRSLQVAEQTVQQRLNARLNMDALAIAVHYKELESQLTPRLKISAQALAGLQRAHRLWRVTIRKPRGS